MRLFSGKIKTSGFGTTLLKCQIIRISKFLDVRLKEFCCIIKYLFAIELQKWIQNEPIVYISLIRCLPLTVLHWSIEKLLTQGRV
jgi:hypothetical protein